MSKESIDELLKETDGRILYIEQLIQLLCSAGVQLAESDIIRKSYAKKKLNKVVEFERQIEKFLGNEVADYLITKIQSDCGSMYWKIHEDSYKMCHGLN